MEEGNKPATPPSGLFGEFRYTIAPLSTGAENINAIALKTALAAIDQPLSGTVRADRLHLVEQRHNGANIMFTPIAEVLLGAAA
ncbi:hypothetical protein ACLF6K_38245 (plasmid) [Streptomyces xanthophaeus]|uniref:hypothetical protein n=1 Tax=Streptomyces xanthophaeus TaxID=67385 RepID=UPI00398FDF81